ncbi:hypothetical protein [Sphingomonas jaspsi]|uniref:hypothetical protein n=1 Tax=Sphingomonas jaspsi TaxID=392409 RepID=UPI0012EC97F8|nr:hypothetical protein [Sphingomonas jaspsi]
MLLAAMLSVAAPASPQFLSFGGYTLVEAREHKVGDGNMAVTPPRPWNRAPRSIFFDLSEVEDWTQNGVYLDGISFVTDLKDKKALIRQYRRDDRQVPVFRSDMTAPEIAAMVESLYRIRGGAVDFRTTSLQPRQFMGYPGFQQDYDHLDGDEVRRRGRVVGAVIGGRLYMAMFDATQMHYFDAGIGDFEAIVRSARLTH